MLLRTISSQEGLLQLIFEDVLLICDAGSAHLAAIRFGISKAIACMHQNCYLDLVEQNAYLVESFSGGIGDLHIL